ncbi:RNase H domain-containing protein [Hirsutella rhossiliensis]|uniref:RNase H domain-containing protein n=1 Tax=Hirsutella rhossiliensis TaxID=111463 RepID=A0A9P8N5R7_9HYPO|nr:RNase H domain-containing protein [Hirsutella rhossiliensis]KAH0968143.1 RNase H domain-containing protein [Hirsutella rhossiliensis]
MPHRGRLQRLSFLLAAWSPECEERKDIAQWAADKGLGLLTTPGEATHARGNTIDLAFANIPSADALIEEHLHTGSDHYTISITLPGGIPPPRTIARPRVSSEEEMKRFEELVRAGATALPRLAVEPRGLEAGRGAVSPTQEAADAAGRRPRKNARGTPWWNDQCGTAEVQTARRELRRARCWPQEDSRLQRHARGCGMRLHLYGQHLPGIDGITVRMLRRVWNHIGEAGAFDTVLRNRLLLRLRNRAGQQTWSGGQAAMEQRSARIRLEDITTPTTPLTCGLPQGSPASPILFLLYTVPIYSTGEPNSRFGYADDVATLIRGRSLQETAARATRAAGELIQWGADNGVVKEPQQDLRWLGVWYDRKLSFRTHVEKWAAKAMTAAGFLQNLSNTRRGIPPRSTRHAVTACVLPILYTAPMYETRRGPSTLQAARDFHSWLRVCPEDTLIVYTDGSQSEDGACGYGYSVWLGPSEVTYGSGRVLLAEVYDAEVEGALEGLRAALTWSPRTPDQQWPIVVCLDNTAAIRAIRGSPSISSQAAAEKFAEAAARHGDVSTRWCPGHTGIAGNERADQLAKEGCRAEGPDRSPTYANIKRQAKAAARRDFQDWWAAGPRAATRA